MLLCAVLMAGIMGQLVVGGWLNGLPLAIVAGALMAIVLHSERGFGVLSRFLGQRWSCLVVAALLTVALSVPTAPPFVIHVLFATLVGACVVREDHLLAPVFRVRALVYVGAISYGIYMLHMLNAVARLLQLAQLPTDGIQVFLLTLIVATAAAGVSFRISESHFLRRKVRHER